jgi:hypothetical protein
MRLEGEQLEFVEEQVGDDQQYKENNFEEGKCNQGPLYL